MAEIAEPERKYVVDASAWISIEGHPGQNLILFCLSKLIEQGRVTCPPEAWGEVLKCPWVHAWLDQYKDQIVSAPRSVDYLMTIGQVTHAFPSMASARGRNKRVSFRRARSRHRVGLAGEGEIGIARLVGRLHRRITRQGRAIPNSC
jgi:hypothetical protein